MFQDLDRGVALIHTRLSILDLSPLGHQPMSSEDGQVVLAFNGEIYNFRELRADLEKRGHVFRGTSDTEVLLKLYLDAHGDLYSLLKKLNGIFALAIWDAQKDVLLLARDGLGVKPLYFAEAEGTFAFASELKALVPMLPQSALDAGSMDLPALQRYLMFQWCPGESTPLKAIRKVSPGEMIVVRRGHVVSRTKWYALPVFRVEHDNMSAAMAVKGTLEHLRTAVHRQMVSDVPVGAFLSGGLDSSSVVALASEVSPSISCFTIDTPGGGEAGVAADLPYAVRVAEHLGVPLEVVSVSSSEMAASLESMVEQLDEPLADPASLNVFFISQLARRHGIKVLLSGAGGDDVFTGYRRHRALMAERYWSWVPRVVRLQASALSSRLDQRHVLLRRARKVLQGADLQGDERIAHYFQWARREDLLPLFAADARNSLDGTDPTAPLLEFLKGLPVTSSPLDRMLALEQRFFLGDHNLTYTDKMSMAVGVEVRVPFLDLELMDFAARVPNAYKQRGGEGKWVLKKAMEPYLPRDIIYRPKTGFGAPLRRWMRFELREMLNDVLSSASLVNRGLFNPAAVHRLMESNDKGRVDASYTLLSLLCIELWCRRFLDRRVHTSSISTLA